MKKESIKAVFFIFFLVIAVTCVSLGFGNFIKSNPVTYSSGEKYLEREEFLFSPLFTSQEDVLVQKFIPQKGYLKNIDIRLAVNYAGLTDTFIIRILLFKEDNVIVQRDVDLTQFSNWEYYTFDIEQEVDVGEEYVIQIQQLVAPKEEGEEKYWISYVVFESPAHIAENENGYYFNGQEQEGELEICYTYYEDNRVMVWRGILVFFLICLSGLVFYTIIKKVKHKSEKIYYCLGLVYWVLIPVLSFFLAEIITGNFWNITADNIIKNIILYYIMFLLVSCFIGRYKVSGAIVVISSSLLAIIQYFVLLFRGRPLMVQDISAVGTAITVLDNYVFSISLRVFGALLANIAVLCLLYFCPKKEVLTSFRIRLLCMAGACGMSLGCYLDSTFLGDVNMWEITSTYQEDGLLLTLIEEVPYLVKNKPEGYSEEKVVEIVNRNQWTGENPEIIPQNIILIMNESFADLSCINNINTNTELLPCWNSINENVIKGYLYMPIFGAGTANAEYEVLTGNTVEFLTVGSTAYQMNVDKEEAGLAAILKAQGYNAVAMHPYYASNWNRTSVYNDMGFDRFIAQENWGDIEYIRWCASDTAVYDKLIEECKASRDKNFIFAVTMQNHGGYADEWDDFKNEVTLLYDKEYPQAEQYLSLIQESDRAFQKLLDYYSENTEPTMIIMFGDHQATLEEEFYEELFGKELEELTFSEVQERYKTPFIVWTNYDIEEKVDVCMSANYFGSYVLDLAGVELPAYNQFLLKLRNEVPVIGLGGIQTKEGIWYPWAEVPEEYKNLLLDYEILQYNNVFDREQRIDHLFLLGGN